MKIDDLHHREGWEEMPITANTHTTHTHLEKQKHTECEGHILTFSHIGDIGPPVCCNIQVIPVCVCVIRTVPAQLTQIGSVYLGGGVFAVWS